MKIYCLKENIKEIEKLNEGRNNLIEANIFKAIFNTFFIKGSIIYNKEKNIILDICEKFLKIPYLYGKIDKIIDFENHYAKIKNMKYLF